MIDLLYKFLVQPALFMMDAETAHQRTLALFGTRPWLLPNYRPPSSDARDVGGVEWAGPVGLAAGMDKGGHALMLWERLGFGAVELGTVTPKPQIGNPRPRIHRLIEHGAIVNKMGFPGEGAIVVQERLEAIKAANAELLLVTCSRCDGSGWEGRCDCDPDDHYHCKGIGTCGTHECDHRKTP